MNERPSDFDLLREFTRERRQPAFATLARRHLDLVFATALRKVEDAGGAEEIAQNVFAALARKAWQFAPDDSLPAWLHKTALLESKAWLRGEMRRRRREETAAELGTTMKTPDDQPAFTALVPLLDEALLSLREKDRTALLLRFYESQSLRELGAAVGVSEDTAQKRVQSALEKLAEFFKRRGFKTATVAAAAAALQHTATTASAAVASAVVNAALQAAPPALAGVKALLARLANLTKAQKAALCIALVVALLFWLWRDRGAGGRGPQPQAIATHRTAGSTSTINLQTNERIMKTTTSTQLSLPLVLSGALMASNALAQPHGQVVVWGDNHLGQTNVPVAAQSGVAAVTIGGYHIVVVKNDGSVVAWGAGTENTRGLPNFGQAIVPTAAQSGVIAIAASHTFSAALKSDGRAVAWGGFKATSGITNVPVSAQGGVRAIATSRYSMHLVALKDNGSVVAWGNNDHGQTNVPAAAQSGVVAIAAGAQHGLALKDDGSVVAWGANYHGITNVPAAAQSGVIAVAAGGWHSLALKNDGSVVAWGAGTNTTGDAPNFGQALVPAAAQTGVTAIAAGYEFSLALKRDGSVVAWGRNDYGQTNVPVAAQSGIVAVSAGVAHAAALKHGGAVVAWGRNNNGQTNVPEGLTGVTAVVAGNDNTAALRGGRWERHEPSQLQPNDRR